MMISSETFARYAAMRVPRYTSYPPAPHFSPAVDHAAYRQWLRQLPADNPVSIYLHIPFCREMCWYCDCHTTVTRRQAPVARYVTTLLKEIELLTAELPTKLAIGHLHLGGGSPTLLTAGDVERLGRMLNSKFDFAAAAEIAVEIDPRTLSGELAEALGGFGVTRASIGAQTFDPEVQGAINRVQPFEVVEAAVNALRNASVGALNFDLIYGLPKQTVRSCLQTVSQALHLRPNRLSVFGYAHVPGFKPHQRKIDPADLPGPAERLAQSNAIAEALVAAGYSRIGLDHFALPHDSLAIAAETGSLRRNFQGYTTDECTSLLGLGASAIGRLRRGFVQNATRIPDYQERIHKGRLAVVRGYRLTEDDERRGAIIERLMCDYRADLGGLDAPLDHLEADGLIRRSGQRIEVVDEARPLVRAVAAAFDAYLQSSPAQHVGTI